LDDIEELLETLQLFYANLERLRLMEGPEMLLPGRVQIYRQKREAAFSAYEKIKEIVDALGHDLQQQQVRLDEGVKRYGEE
jgi:hypothetical protein